MTSSGEPGDNRQPILSVEELEALLRAPAGPEEGDSPPGGTSRVMLVSKRPEDLGPLATALAGEGFEVTTARNPFTALDYLRARDFEVVITDFSLWRSQKDLLFERIAQLDSTVEVVYMCDADSSTLEDVRSTRARWVMRRPVDVVELAGHVREVAGAASDEVTDFEQSTASPISPEARSSSQVVRWYKFFFNVRREMRQSNNREERWLSFLDRFVVAQGGGAVALLDITKTSDGCSNEGLDLRVVRVKAALASTIDQAHGREVLKRRLKATLGEAKRSMVVSGATSSLTSNGAFVLGFPVASPSRLLVSVAPPSRAAIEIPPVIAAELPFLLEDVDLLG